MASWQCADNWVYNFQNKAICKNLTRRLKKSLNRLYVQRPPLRMFFLIDYSLSHDTILISCIAVNRLSSVNRLSLSPLNHNVRIVQSITWVHRALSVFAYTRACCISKYTGDACNILLLFILHVSGFFCATVIFTKDAGPESISAAQSWSVKPYTFLSGWLRVSSPPKKMRNPFGLAFWPYF